LFTVSFQGQIEQGFGLEPMMFRILLGFNVPFGD